MKIFNFCKKYIFKYKGLFIIYILLNIFMGILGIVIPLLTGKIVDNLTYIKSKEVLINFCILFAIINIVNMIMRFLSSYLYTKLQTKSGYSLNKYVINHIQDVSMSHFLNTDTTYLNQRINNDSNSIIIFCISVIINVIVNIITFIFSAILLIRINCKIALIMFFLLALYIFTYAIFKKPLYQKSFEVKEANAGFFSKLNEQLFNIKFIKVHSTKEIFSKRLEIAFNEVIKKLISSQKLGYLYASCDSIISLVAQLSIFLLGGFAIINRQMTIGFYIIMTNYFGMIMSSSRYFFNLGKTYQDNLVSYKRIIDILSIPQQGSGKLDINNIENVKIENLTFGYYEKNIFTNYNFEFEKGKIYVLTGHNGAGKSTLISIILGLYEGDYEGKISYNNIDIKEINMYKTLQKNIGVTEQEPILIPDTLINNITLEKYFDLSLINEYINILGLDKYVLSLENGLETIINEKSSNISGGEKQKISILRQFLKNPDIMIFDEPSSALDSDSKKKFKNYLSKIKKEKIIIIISHDDFIDDLCDCRVNINEN